MSSQSKRYKSDNNGDGLVDGSKNIRLATDEGQLSIQTWKGKSVPIATKLWEAEKAVMGSTVFKVLLKGKRGRQEQFKVLELNNVGVVNGESKWQSISKALRKGWESDFGDVIQRDGVIGRNFEQDANGDGLFDRGQREAYRIVTDSKQALTLFSSNGEKLSSISSQRWEAVQALEVNKGFQVLLQKGSGKKIQFKLLYVNDKGVTTKQTKWKQSAEALFAGWDVRFKSSILAPSNSGGTVDAASVDGNDNEGQLIYTATASDESSVTFSLESLDDGSLSGLSIDANSGEVRLNPDSLLSLPDSIGFSVVATDLAGNSTSTNVVVSLTVIIANSDEVSAGSDAGLSAMSVQEMLSDESDAAENSIVEADEQDNDLDDVDESSEESNISDSGEELTDTAAEQDMGSDAVLSDNSETDSGDSDDIPGVDSLNPVDAEDIPTLRVSVDGESDEVTNDNTPEFSGLASAGATVQVLAADVVLGSVVADEQGVWALSVADEASLADGEYLFTARELKPNVEDASISKALSLNIDRTAPVFTSSSDAEATLQLTTAQVDSDLDGLLDGSNGSKIVDQDKIIQIKRPKKELIFAGSSDKPLWGYDVVRAVPNPDPEQEGAYKLLLKGTGVSNRGLFGEWSIDSDGHLLASNESIYQLWISESQALRQGWEQVYGDVIKIDGEITEVLKKDSSNTSGTYFVATDGDDANPGTIELPLATINYASTLVQPGDHIKLRGGTYKERVHIDSIHGTENAPITISNYDDEKVVLEGAKDIATEWVGHEGNIWKTTVDFDVTQLFVDDAMLIGARWPNINKHWDEYDESDGDNSTPGSYWDLGTRSYADRTAKVDTGANQFKNNETSHSLSDLKASVEGGVVVVNGVGPKVLDITSHNAGDATFETSTGADDLEFLADYYITADLDLLDSEREWFYDKETKELYVWLENNANPNQASIKARGYTEEEHKTDSDRILKVYDSSHINFDGITVQTGAFHLRGSHNLTFENSKFLYSGHHKQMLGADINNAVGEYANYVNISGNETGGPAGLEDRKGDASLTWRRCEFASSYSNLLYHGRGGSNYLVEDCYFHNKPHGGGMLWSAGVNDGNIVRHSTFHTGGWGGMGKFGNRRAQQGGKALAEFNRIYDFHFHSDDAGIQVNTGNVMGMTLRNNWIYDLPGRNGIRFDGDPGGMGGIANNNVIFGVKRGSRWKGDLHTFVNNVAFNNTHNDIHVSHDKFYGFTAGYDPAVDGIIRPKPENNYFNIYDYRAEGRRGSSAKLGNKHSIAVNNAGNHDSYPFEYETPGIQANSGTRSRGNILQSELRDHRNFDFRLNSDSPLIDAGVAQHEITDGFLGFAPDIGAYEFGDLNYWIPGHRTDKARSPIPMDLSPRVRPTSDLIWLGGIDAVKHRIYLGTDPNKLELMSEQTNNIYSPDTPFRPDEIYFWRVDSIKDDGEVVTGDVWEFSTPIGQEKAIPIEMVHVGDSGNQANFDGYGHVPYEYYISKYEITNEQYAAFLNDTGKVTTKDGLTDRYHDSMKIDRLEINGEFVYTVEEGYEKYPVNYVDFRSALRFCNWLTSGNINTGTYNSIWGANNGINKRSWNEMEIGAVALPTEDEWYKAAYFSGQPAPGDWTNQAPNGWSIINGNKHGQPILEQLQDFETADEFNGWTFQNIKSWSRISSQRSIRNRFDLGQGTIAVIDPFEFALEKDGVISQSEISTPSIDISGAQAGQLKLSFDSSWPKHEANYASVLISYDGADPVPVFSGKASPRGKWGINSRKSVDLNNPEGAQSAVVTWSYESNDNFWAIDNILISDEQNLEYFSEGFDDLELQSYQSTTLPQGDQGYFSNAIQDADLSRWPTGNYSDGPTDPVGSHSSPSYYGTFDQAGSLQEWLEADNSIDSNGSRVRGGWYSASNKAYFTASARENALDKKRRIDDIRTGFRVVSLYPIAPKSDEVENHRPSWIAARWSLGDAVVGSLFSRSLTEEVFDPDNDVKDLTFTLLSGPAWLSIDSGGNLNGRPTSTDLGSKEVMLRVTDPDGEYSDTDFPVTLNVNLSGDTTDPLDETVMEPVTEPAEEAVTEPVAEPAEEAVTEPVAEPVTEPVTEPVAEPVAEQPVTEPVTESVEEAVTEPVTEPVEEAVLEPVTEPFEEPVTESVVDTISISGTGSFGKKNADRITNFDPASQRLEINTQSFGVQSDALFSTSNSKKVKRSAKTDIDFIYHQKTGQLYFNQNGSDKRWGDGGLFAIFDDNPEITSQIVDLV